MSWLIRNFVSLVLIAFSTPSTVSDGTTLACLVDPKIAERIFPDITLH
jgi:hypothetical protein